MGKAKSLWCWACPILLRQKLAVVWYGAIILSLSIGWKRIKLNLKWRRTRREMWPAMEVYVCLLRSRGWWWTGEAFSSTRQLDQSGGDKHRISSSTWGDGDWRTSWWMPSGTCMLREIRRYVASSFGLWSLNHWRPDIKSTVYIHIVMLASLSSAWRIIFEMLPRRNIGVCQGTF